MRVKEGHIGEEEANTEGVIQEAEKAGREAGRPLAREDAEESRTHHALQYPYIYYSV